MWGGGGEVILIAWASVQHQLVSDKEGTWLGERPASIVTDMETQAHVHSSLSLNSKCKGRVCFPEGDALHTCRQQIPHSLLLRHQQLCARAPSLPGRRTPER